MIDMFVEYDAFVVDYSFLLNIEDGTINNLAMTVSST